MSEASRSMSEARESALGTALAVRRARRGKSLADLAAATFVSRGWINNVEAGRRWPHCDWVELADRELGASGELVAVWRRENLERERESVRREALRKSERESQLLLAAEPDAVDLDEINQLISELAVTYLSSPPGPMLNQAMSLRGELIRRLSIRNMKSSRFSDLHVGLSRVSGILAYAALDLGDAQGAATHGAVSYKMAAQAGDSELMAWSRGTQSLIARFDKDYVLGQELINDGMKYAGQGTSEIRLICGAAQCAANLGDSTSARALLVESNRERERSTQDAVEGLFGFSRAKQAYYSASSLMWLSDNESLQDAETNAMLAIETWVNEPPEQRSLDDEALAQVYLATARLKMGELEGAMHAARTVLELPEDRQISWIVNRLADLSELLGNDRFKNSKVASSARDELLSYRT
ncbi:helix-turn-helix domain-containing protein [Kribbella solani]|uniref:Transcriptional regulator with XRE-family HTH domain n=1 Tax=Kribbella solani TaxID=236067 RepID=A0A841E4S2_9ACTN|nr:helix-turn-helix transcriptional regulator [Kribbella solani]MBB5983377.1 transcriptional regulator with XRE-family HTH domain [Kribbella solani]